LAYVLIPASNNNKGRKREYPYSFTVSQREKKSVPEKHRTNCAHPPGDLLCNSTYSANLCLLKSEEATPEALAKKKVYQNLLDKGSCQHKELRKGLGL